MDSNDSPAAQESRPSGQAGEVRSVTLWGLAVNLALAGVKFVFGVVGSSQALVADAVHSLSDSFTDLAVVIGAGFWTAPADA
ncbi:MAG: cation transporter, partial [Planctomycetes bacterium]|nr:cation transporter [Planctomycetota bacterium]